jgi:iron complex transport system substrate-binding protein
MTITNNKISGLLISWPLALICLVALSLCFEPGPKQKKTIRTNGITVTDMKGATITLDGPAQTVFILTPILWHYLSVNLDDQPVVKIPPYMVREFNSSFLGSAFPNLKKKSLAFTNFTGPAPISVEEILQSSPDVALVWDYMSKGLELINFQGLVKTTADGGDKTKIFNTLADLTGQKERVKWLWERFERRRAKVIEDLGDCREPVKAVVIGTTGLTLWGPPSQRWFMDNMKKVCGENAADGFGSANGQLNVENLLILDPDVIYLNPYILDLTNLDTRTILDDPRLRGLKAVRDKRVYHMPLGGSRLEGPVEAALAILWLRLTLHPEAPTVLDLPSEVRQTYREVYGYEMTDDEINVWLRLDENLNSANYDRFAGKESSDGGI